MCLQMRRGQNTKRLSQLHHRDILHIYLLRFLGSLIPAMFGYLLLLGTCLYLLLLLNQQVWECSRLLPLLSQQ